MKYPWSHLVLSAGLSASLAASHNALAASHREAPITALDHKADITDFYAFQSYDERGRTTLILNVDPLLEPSNGPNYFPFDPEVTYAIHIDNDRDAKPDVTFEFRFKTAIRAPSVFTGFVGAGDGLLAPANSPAPVPPGTPIVPPAITALDGSGSEGLSLRQSYRVTMIRYDGGYPRRIKLSRGQDLFAVPTNVGPRTMPDYESLVQQGIYDIRRDVRVFAGTVEDPFWIDLGAAFDSLNFRPSAFSIANGGTGVPGVLSEAQDADDNTNFAPDDVSGHNVNSIAIEVPTELLTSTGALHGADEPEAVIGAWATTSRPRIKIYSQRPGAKARTSPQTVQIQRMGNALINELIIGTGAKDKWSMSEPHRDKRFADFALDPVLARVLNAIYEIDIPEPPRVDLLPLVQYLPPIAPTANEPGPIADLLRLNTGIPATPAFERRRLGVLAGDLAGFPNGRRVSDDVTDIASRVVAGVLAGAPFNGFPHNAIGDGVNRNDVEYRETFPYVAAAHSGRDSAHVDPGEPGCNGTCPVD